MSQRDSIHRDEANHQEVVNADATYPRSLILVTSPYLADFRFEEESGEQFERFPYTAVHMISYNHEAGR